jgi:hypothetical protein
LGHRLADQRVGDGLNPARMPRRRSRCCPTLRDG